MRADDKFRENKSIKKAEYMKNAMNNKVTPLLNLHGRA